MILPDLVLQSEEKLNSFLSKNEQRIRNDSIISFAFPINNINLISKLNSFDKYYNDYLFLNKLDEGLSFVALNRLIDLPSNGNDFQSLRSSIVQIKSRMISNSSELNIESLPFITGGIKFDQSKSSDEWNNFNPVHFFVPELIIFKKESNTFLIYNHQVNSKTNLKKVLNEFNDYVSSFFNLKNIINEKRDFVFKNQAAIKDDKQTWCKLVNSVKDILDEKFNKVVLSRRIEYETREQINWVKCFHRLNSEFPDCYLFKFKADDAIFFGASPEKFISVNDKKIETDALAGSAPGKCADIKAELLTDKNMKEHKYVIDFIRETLSKFANNINVDINPQIKKLKNVQHLSTKITGELISQEEVLNLIDSLFPTPAVCGFPKQKAFNTIGEIEKFDRGLYSGLIGWIDLKLNCEFTVALNLFDEKIYD
jgi:menaquinone-specific isochorismate synthase